MPRISRFPDCLENPGIWISEALIPPSGVEAGSLQAMVPLFIDTTAGQVAFFPARLRKSNRKG